MLVKINKEVTMEDKIKKLILNIEGLKNKLNGIQSDYNLKYNKVQRDISLAEEKILDLRMKLLKDKEIPKDLEYQFGIRWIAPDLDEFKDLSKEEIEEEEKFQNEIGIEFLE